MYRENAMRRCHIHVKRWPGISSPCLSLLFRLRVMVDHSLHDQQKDREQLVDLLKAHEHSKQDDVHWQPPFPL